MKKSKMIRKNVNKRSKKKSLAFILIIIIILSFNLFSTFNLFTQQNSLYNDKKLKFNGLWASLELTNPGEVNNSLFTHSASISVKGRLHNKINASVDTSGINVAIEVNDIMDMGYTDITDIDGNFSINYIINPLLDVYTAHKIEVMVTDTGLPGDIEYLDFYMINVNATSYFDIISNDNPSTPKLTEEIFNLNGYLNYDNNIGIPFESVNYYW
ncbi:unnamed protein product, partial [marine sediment metagenome]